VLNVQLMYSLDFHCSVDTWVARTQLLSQDRLVTWCVWWYTVESVVVVVIVSTSSHVVGSHLCVHLAVLLQFFGLMNSCLPY